MAPRSSICRSASVYTSLQTGVVDAAENGVNVYLSNKHYEVAPVMSLSEHEANDNCIWVSDKAWNSFSDERRNGCRRRPTRSTLEPAYAIELEHQSMAKLEKMGVKFVKDVDKSGFVKVAEPIQDKIAERSRTARGRAASWRMRASVRERVASASALACTGSWQRTRTPSRLVLETQRHLKWRALDLDRGGD